MNILKNLTLPNAVIQSPHNTLSSQKLHNIALHNPKTETVCLKHCMEIGGIEAEWYKSLKF